MVIRHNFSNKGQFTYHLSKRETDTHKGLIVSFKLECIPVSDGLCQSYRDPSESFEGKDDM